MVPRTRLPLGGPERRATGLVAPPLGRFGVFDVQIGQRLPELVERGLHFPDDQPTTGRADRAHLDLTAASRWPRSALTEALRGSPCREDSSASRHPPSN